MAGGQGWLRPARGGGYGPSSAAATAAAGSGLSAPPRRALALALSPPCMASGRGAWLASASQRGRGLWPLLGRGYGRGRRWAFGPAARSSRSRFKPPWHCPWPGGQVGFGQPEGEGAIAPPLPRLRPRPALGLRPRREALSLKPPLHRSWQGARPASAVQRGGELPLSRGRDLSPPPLTGAGTALADAGPAPCE